MKEAELRVGVIGVGNFARNALIPQLLATGRAELIAISRRNKVRLEEAQRELNVNHIYTDWRDLLKQATPDAVIIATSHNTHAEIAIEALKSGAHVFVEKPMALNAKDAWDMVDVAENAGRVLMVGYNSRFSTAWQSVKKALDLGVIGKARQLNVAWCINGRWLWETDNAPQNLKIALEKKELGGDWIKEGSWLADPGKAGGGMFVSDACHVIDLLIWLGGAPVNRIVAFQENAGLSTDCFMTVQAVLVNGVHVSLVFGAGVDAESGFFGDGRMSIHGDMGVLKVDWQSWNPSRDTKVQVTAKGETTIVEESPENTPISSFIETILDGAPNRCSAQEAAYTDEFIEGAYKSAATGQIVDIIKHEA